jgi:DNA-binding winged helix-turn-helix (wHTH) protein
MTSVPSAPSGQASPTTDLSPRGAPVRFRFGPFALSPSRRTLHRGDEEVPLIPRYFDLLLLLVERRHEAVDRRRIFDSVWSDVVVSDGALTQAVRTLRRALGDDPREPVYIRTVSRHGYRFVWAQVVEEADGPPGVGAASVGGEEQLADPPPIALGRGLAAAGGAGLLGLGAGLVGGLLLRWAAGWNVPATVSVALGLVGATVGAIGGLGVGLGLAVAEAQGRRWRRLSLPLLGALGGATVGAAAQVLGRWTLEGLFGRSLPPVGGGWEGLAVGGAVGLGFAFSSPPPQGSGLPPSARLRAAAVAGIVTACVCVAVGVCGGRLVGVSLNAMARVFQGSQVGLAPLARRLGEPDLGPLTRAVLGAWEGLLFAVGTVLGFTRRQR